MTWFSPTRLVVLIGIAIFVAFLVVAANMGMFGTMFEPFFGAS